MALVPQHIDNRTSKLKGQPLLQSIIGRLGVDQAVKEPSQARNVLSVSGMSALYESADQASGNRPTQMPTQRRECAVRQSHTPRRLFRTGENAGKN